MNEINSITIDQVPTVIEIDPSCHSVYVRFKRAKIHRTISESKPGAMMAIDLDARGKVIGIELIGVANISVSGILRRLPPQFRNMNLDHTRFMPANECRPQPVPA
jgi:uncharacterized protein YuzE